MAKKLTVGVDPIEEFATTLQRELSHREAFLPHRLVGLQHPLDRRYSLSPDVDLKALRERECDALCAFAEGIRLYQVGAGILCLPVSGTVRPWCWPKYSAVRFWAPRRQRVSGKARERHSAASPFPWELLAVFWLWPMYIVHFIGIAVLGAVFAIPDALAKSLTSRSGRDDTEAR